MKNVLLLAISVLCPLAAWSADYTPLDVKTGLWESTTTHQVAGALPPAVLARLTPEQRAQVEAAMKAQAAQGAKTTATKSCLTKEELNKPLTFNQDKQLSCKNTLVKSSPSAQDFRMDCTGNDVVGSMTVHIDRIDSENVKGAVQINGAGGGNKMISQTGFTAKWLSSDCGDEKPAQ